MASRSTERTFHGKGIELQQGFQDWWVEARKSDKPPTPYDFLVNMGVETGLAQDLVCRILASVVAVEMEAPIEAGAIDYFVQHAEDAFDYDSDEEDHWQKAGVPNLTDFGEECPVDALLRRGLGPDGPSEQDIKSLTKVASIWDWEEAVQNCVSRNFSPEFQLFFWQQCPKTKLGSLRFVWDPEDQVTESHNFRPAMDIACLRVLDKMLPEANSVEFDCPWTKEAFAHCLQTMLHSKKIKSWTMTLPNEFIGPTLNVGSQTILSNSTTVLPAELPPPNGTCGVERFSVCLSEENKAANSLVLDCLPHMIHLRNLYLNCKSYLDRAVPPIIQALNRADTTLQNISIIPEAAPTGRPLLDLLEALKTNSSLVKFVYRCESYESKQTRDLYGEALLDLLQEHNTTLQSVYFPYGPRLTRKMFYYLDLNRCRRDIARDPATKVADFVAFLCHLNDLPSRPDRVTGIRLDPINRWYGLLREQPGMWSASGNQRKRKRS